MIRWVPVILIKWLDNACHAFNNIQGLLIWFVTNLFYVLISADLSQSNAAFLCTLYIVYIFVQTVCCIHRRVSSLGVKPFLHVFLNPFCHFFGARNIPLFQRESHFDLVRLFPIRVLGKCMPHFAGGGPMMSEKLILYLGSPCISIDPVLCRIMCCRMRGCCVAEVAFIWVF